MRINPAAWSLLLPAVVQAFASCGDATRLDEPTAGGGGRISGGRTGAGASGAAAQAGAMTEAGAPGGAGEAAIGGGASGDAGAGGTMGSAGAPTLSGGGGAGGANAKSESGGAPSAGGTMTSGGSESASGGVINATGGVVNANGGVSNGGAPSGGVVNANGGLSGSGGNALSGLEQRPSNTTCLAPARNMPPASLKLSGCSDPGDATKPAAGLIPYGVNSPLWSDGAQKERWLALPDTGKIHINADGDWDLPNGSVLIKTFWLGGKRVETRLFVRESNGNWSGYSYAWDDAQTDATLLPDATSTKQVGSQTWLFPSRKQCSDCHRQIAGYSLGLETGQLNGEFTYPNGRTANQLATFESIGLFDAPLPTPVASAPRFPSPTLASSGSLESRSKAYVHANCSHCHRPGGVSAPFDMRYQTAFAQMGLCNVAPQNNGFGSFYVSPGLPNDSAILGHMRSSTKGRMPPLATSIVDDAGTQVISDWIASLSACP